MADGPRLFLIDGTALAYRSYFAFIRNPLVNSKGQDTSAAFGFTSALLRLLEEEAPDRVAVVFDSSEPTARHEKFPDYKATREKMPEEMAGQLPLIDRVVEALGLTALQLPGYEADDVIGTLARRAEEAGWECYIVTGDKDFTQLVDERVRLYDIMKRGAEPEVVDRQAVEKKLGVPPEKVVDVLGLMGDSSDNIPGVPGIGPKTAVQLVETYGSLEAAVEHASEIKAKRVREGLEAKADEARLSKELVTLDTGVPVEFDAEGFGRREPDARRVLELFEELEFQSLMGKVEPPGDEQEDATAYRIVRSPKEFDALVARLEEAEELALDLETTSQSPMEAEIVGLSFAVREREAWYVPAYPQAPLVEEGDGLFDRQASQLEAILDRLRPVLENPGKAKGGQNIKYDAIVLANHGVELRGIAFDTMVESYLLAPAQRQHNLDLLALKHLNYKKIPTTDLIGKGKDQISMRQVPVEQVGPYACEDADIALRLHRIFVPQLRERGLEELYRQVEVPLVGVLADMERRGVRVDLELLAELSADFQERIDALAREIHELAGEEFNINSTQQLGAVLFEKMEIQKGRNVRVRRTKTGYATSVGALEPYAEEPIVGRLLEYRTLTKLKNTYVDAFPQLVNPRTGKIHTSFNQTVTATGRLSSSEPNLQNIPIRTPLGRTIRQAFLPGEASRRLLTADYSQVELRILAHLCGDPQLTEAFRQGQDIHRRTASEIFGVPIDQVTSTQRSQAKAINFGIIYGMGPQRLARDTGISLDDAKAFIDRYFERYPRVKTFIDDTVLAAERDGAVQTLLGRQRPIPEIYSQQRNLRLAAERIAVNTPIQGTAADLIKVAMVRIHRRLADAHPQAWMILQVHDELVFDVPAEAVEAVGELVRREMEGAVELDVPLRVDLAAGTTWSKA
ncbi:MAG: DNA polymerase I [bacterium]